MGPAEFTEGEFAGVNADAYAEVAAGEAQTFDPIMRGAARQNDGAIEKWGVQENGSSSLAVRHFDLVDPFPI